MGGRRYEGDQIQAIFTADTVKLFLLFKRNIRKDQTVHADFRCLFHKTLCPIGENDICVSHEYHRNLCIFPDFHNHIKYFIGSDTAG